MSSITPQLALPAAFSCLYLPAVLESSFLSVAPLLLHNCDKSSAPVRTGVAARGRAREQGYLLEIYGRARRSLAGVGSLRW